MSTTVKLQCAICDKNAGIFLCGGCNQAFCSKHSTEHRQVLGKQVEEIMLECDLIRQNFNDENDEMQRLEAEKKIDSWQQDAVEKILRIAEQARQQFKEHVIERRNMIKANVQKLTDSLRMAQIEENFIENDLQQWMDEINKLKGQVSVPIQIALRKNDDKLVQYIPQSYFHLDARIVELFRDTGSFGFNIRTVQENNSPIYISKISPGGVAARQGGLRVGDRLVSVNDILIENGDYQKTTDLVVQAKDSVKLVVHYALHDYNRHQEEHSSKQN